MQRLGKQPTSQRANPHSCRENWPVSTPGMIVAGSSPLTRGKPHARPPRPTRQRLIPTHAGKTPSRGAHGRGCAAHPRSRGENAVHATTSSTVSGSSPLTRGKQQHVRGFDAGPGLIPTHAGKTAARARFRRRTRAHPHSRGENFASVLMLRSTVGASPLTQGKRHDPDHHSASTVLPRSHGENKQLLVAAASQRGSSPLTRGKLLCGYARRRLSRLIPAHAGKTRPHSRRCSWDAAHPRSRGENAQEADHSSQFPGSSPLTRGKRNA